MQNELKNRLNKLEKSNRVLMALLISTFLLAMFRGGTVNTPGDTVRCERLEVVDSKGKVLAMIGTDTDGSTGLFVYDNAGQVRTAAIHDNSQSAFYAYDSTGTIRVGLAQFAHGGGGLALHGEQSKGAAVLYYKKSGSLRFFDTEGKVTHQVPEKK